MKKLLLTLLILVIIEPVFVTAQCAMCKTTIVNNVSSGELALAEGLNFGIMYLFFTPYVVVAAIAALWIYKSRKHASNTRTSHS
jgi:uncharacterized membrane protein